MMIRILALGALIGFLVGLAVLGTTAAIVAVLAVLAFFMGEGLLALATLILIAFTLAGIVYAYLEIRK